MPEGPEIQRAADRVASVLVGEEAKAVFFAFPSLSAAGSMLTGRTVTRVEAQGKAMLTWFDDEHVVYSHNQLYGKWVTRKGGAPPKTGRQLRFAVHTAAGSAFLYSASDIALLDRDTVGQHPYLSKLGPNPLDRTTTAKVIRDRLMSPAFRRRRLAGSLLDQSCVAGLGNYLRSEILFCSGVHPGRRPVDLEPDALAALARATNLITRRAYRTAGITNDAARVRAAKKAGEPRRTYRHYVFARAGLPCRECGARVRKEQHAGRRIYLCPACQPAP